MTKAKLEEGNLVLCSVTKIIGTTVFIHLDEYNIDGTLSFPEVAPGRIRNIRDYAFPGKKIVCKVLKIHPQLVEVSYLAAGKYFIKIKTKDPRHADQQLRKMLENLETLSKKSGCIFNVEK